MAYKIPKTDDEKLEFIIEFERRCFAVAHSKPKRGKTALSQLERAERRLFKMLTGRFPTEEEQERLDEI